MPILAKRLSRVKPSATVAVTTRAAELKREGRDIISLGAGEPDFDTPKPIRDAGIRAIEQGKTRYAPTAGIIELREAIKNKFAKENQLDYKIEQLTIGCGAKQLIAAALLASLDPGDEVIIPAPYWVSYPDMTILGDGVPVTVVCDEKDGFKLTPEKFQKAITVKTKWLLLNSPANPTGEIYSRDELLALAEILEKHPEIMVLSDDIYEHIRYNDTPFHNLATVAPALQSRILLINGVSKTYCMTGWRLGYAAGPTTLIKGINIILSQSSTSAATPSQWAALEALEGDQSFIPKHNAVFKKRRDFVYHALRNIDGLECRLPEGAFYLYPSCAGWIGKKTPDGKIIETDQQVAEFLLEQEGIAIVHGTAFGLSPFFRISYATSDAILEEACKRLMRAGNQLL